MNSLCALKDADVDVFKSNVAVNDAGDDDLSSISTGEMFSNPGVDVQ
jgi:hypothetical protein